MGASQCFVFSWPLGVVLLALRLGLSGDGKWSPVFCFKAAALIRSELFGLDVRDLWLCPEIKPLPA